MISKTSLPFNGTTASDLVTGANKTMVGGGHYHQGNKGFQHWDLVVYNKLGYLEGQITRYISRARHKNGLEDFRKAHHYVLKMKEMFSIRIGGVFGFFERRMYEPQHSDGVVSYNNVRRFCREQDLTTLETNAMLMACQWLTMQDLMVLESMTHELVRGAELSSVNCKVKAAVAELNRAGVLREPGKHTIELTRAEVQSGMDRVRWAELLITQLPPEHEGRNSWLLNYGRKDRGGQEGGPDGGYVCQDPDLLRPAPLPHPNDTLYQVHPDSQQ